MAATTGGQSLAYVLVVLGIVSLAFLPLYLLVNWMRRRATSRWADVSPLDSSYSGTLKRSLYKAARVKVLSWFGVLLGAIGVGCLVAGGIAALLGK